MQVDLEHPGQRSDGEEGGRGDRATLDLAQRVQGNTRSQSHLGGTSITPGPLQSPTKHEATLALVRRQRCANHATIIFLVLESYEWRY